MTGHEKSISAHCRTTLRDHILSRAPHALGPDFDGPVLLCDSPLSPQSSRMLIPEALCKIQKVSRGAILMRHFSLVNESHFRQNLGDQVSWSGLASQLGFVLSKMMIRETFIFSAQQPIWPHLVFCEHTASAEERQWSQMQVQILTPGPLTWIFYFISSCVKWANETFWQL